MHTRLASFQGCPTQLMVCSAPISNTLNNLYRFWFLCMIQRFKEDTKVPFLLYIKHCSSLYLWETYLLSILTLKRTKKEKQKVQRIDYYEEGCQARHCESSKGHEKACGGGGGAARNGASWASPCYSVLFASTECFGGAVSRAGGMVAAP